MPNTVELAVRKSRLSLSLKRSNDQAINNTESNDNKKLNEHSICEEPSATSSNNKITSNDGREEEEMIPCSQIEDKLVFSLKSDPSNCNEAQASIMPEQKKENSSSAETYFPGLFLEHDRSKDSSLDEDKVNIEDDSSIDIFNSPKDKVSEIPNERTENLTIDIKEKANDQNSSSEFFNNSIEVDVCAISDERNDNEKMECSSMNEEIVNVSEEFNEISNSPEVKMFKILKENERIEESKCCEKKHNDLPPIIKRNVVIADSDEEFEEFVNQKRKFKKKIENTNSSNSQKENSMSKCQEQIKVSSSSRKEKSKALKSHRDKSNVSKTSKKKSNSLTLKRKIESVDNSDDEFEKPFKHAKKTESPQRASTNKDIKKSKKLKKPRKSDSLST